MELKIADWFKALVFATFLILSYLFIGTITHILVILVISSIIVYLINPLVIYLSRIIKSRAWAIVAAYLAFFIILAAIIYLAIPLISNQITVLGKNIPKYIKTVDSIIRSTNNYLKNTVFGRFIRLEPGSIFEQVGQTTSSMIENFVAFLPSVFGVLGRFLIIFVVSLNLLAVLPAIDQAIKSSANKDVRNLYENFLINLKQQLSNYMKGVLILMLSVGALTGIGLWIVGVPSPAILGIIAGLFEIIPYFGPILSAIPAVIVALSVSPVTALLTILVFVVVQLLEGYALSPLIHGKTIEIHPLIVLLLLLIGGEISGVLGIILAVPVFLIIKSVVLFIRDNFSYIHTEEGPDYITIKRKLEKENRKEAA